MIKVLKGFKETYILEYAPCPNSITAVFPLRQYKCSTCMVFLGVVG